MSGMVRQMKEGMELLIQKEVFRSRISLAFSRLSVFRNMLSLFCFQVKTCSLRVRKEILRRGLNLGRRGIRS